MHIFSNAKYFLKSFRDSKSNLRINNIFVFLCKKNGVLSQTHNPLLPPKLQTVTMGIAKHCTIGMMYNYITVLQCNGM